ncbi:MAG: hypothetical protein QM535_06885 [Limnohabitans sp.]|nr:hypothetical protein [Limnohabitans sp.]
MTSKEFEKLSKDLQNLAKIIPLHWGQIQNDKTDGLVDMFSISSFEELEHSVQSLEDEIKNYFRRRWFIWKCAQCDEYLFSVNKNVSPNPNSRDQSYDIEFFNDTNLRFDVKGTVIPKEFRNEINTIIEKPQPMIDFFYQRQSTGVRSFYQNRLFIIHHSFKKQEREMYLRCHWEFKEQVYKLITQQIQTKTDFLKYKEFKIIVLFLFENENGSFEFKML